MFHKNDNKKTYLSLYLEQTFKNPFDLIEEEEEEPMSMPTRNKYVPPASNVHAPLPFNPYELSKQEPQSVKKGAAVSMV